MSVYLLVLNLFGVLPVQPPSFVLLCVPRNLDPFYIVSYKIGQDSLDIQYVFRGLFNIMTLALKFIKRMKCTVCRGRKLYLG